MVTHAGDIQQYYFALPKTLLEPPTVPSQTGNYSVLAFEGIIPYDKGELVYQVKHQIPSPEEFSAFIQGLPKHDTKISAQEREKYSRVEELFIKNGLTGPHWTDTEIAASTAISQQFEHERNTLYGVPGYVRDVAHVGKQYECTVELVRDEDRKGIYEFLQRHGIERRLFFWNSEPGRN